MKKPIVIPPYLKTTQRLTEQLKPHLGKPVAVLLQSKGLWVIDAAGELQKIEYTQYYGTWPWKRTLTVYSITFPGDRPYELFDLNFTLDMIKTIQPKPAAEDHPESEQIIIHLKLKSD